MVSKCITLDQLAQGSAALFFLHHSFPPFPIARATLLHVVPKSCSHLGSLHCLMENPVISSCTSLPFASGPYLPDFIFQQVTAMMVIFAFYINPVCSLLTRLRLPFSACLYFKLSAASSPVSALLMSTFRCPSVHSGLVLCHSWGHSLPVPSFILFPLLETSPLSRLAKQLTPYQYMAPPFPFKADFPKSSPKFDGSHCCEKVNISPSVLKARSLLLMQVKMNKACVLGRNNDALFSH